MSNGANVARISTRLAPHFSVYKNSMTKRRMADADSDAAALQPQAHRTRDSSHHGPFTALSTPAKRLSAEHAVCTPSASGAPAEWPRPVDVRAFGLEDRAQAVIAMGRSSWSLANLSKWRSDSLSPAGAALDATSAAAEPLTSKEYVRQRQRAYMKRCLAKPATG